MDAELKAACAELSAWLRSGNTTPIDLNYLMKVKGPTKIISDINRLLAAAEAMNNRHGAGDAERSAELTTAWMAGVERERDRAARDAEAWLSIESAPFADLQHTHPTDCLVWSPKIGGVRLGRVWRYPDGEPCGQAVGYSGEWEITHWRPLPAPPTDDAARARGVSCS